MTFQHQSGEDFSAGGNFLREPGTYHVCVTGVEEMPHKRDGSLIDNAAFQVDLEVLAGTVGGQEKKSANIVFFHPKPTSPNEGAFARKLMDRFFLAVGLMGEADKKKDLSIDLQQAVGRHFIVKFDHDDDKKYLRVAFTDIFHVDDPAVKDMPKSETAMKMGGAWRQIGAKSNTPASKPATNGAASPQPEKQPATSAADQWSDL